LAVKVQSWTYLVPLFSILKCGDMGWNSFKMI
jgi:hypothetical protein